jgi:Skp family chaperone for outer membrane proteins
MQFLKNSNRLFLALILISACASPGASKVVALDIVTIYEEYSLVQEANETIDAGEARFKRILATAEKELKELEKKGSPIEIDKKRLGIQDIVDQEVEVLQDHKELYNTTINRNVAKTLAAMALANNYELILDSSFVHSNIEDITEKFLAELEKTTIPVKLEE